MAVNMHFGPVPHQRCLTHIVRTAKKRLLPENSPFTATRELRKIAQELTCVEFWRDEVEWWYTHGNLRRGYRLLTYDQKPFFVYLDHPIIPSSNNSLEGTNSQSAKRLRNHRGMKTRQQVSFLYWYFSFQRINNRQDLKRLWDYWKKEIWHRLSTQKLT